MKTILLKIHALSFFIVISVSGMSTKAQQKTEIIPPIIDLILNESEAVITPGDNSPPINSIPASTAQSPVQIPFEFGQVVELLVSVSDIDNNLASIRIDSSRLGLFGIEPNSDVDFQPITAGFIITGSQENLVQAITPIFYLPLFEILEGEIPVEITITSTDELGEFDQDSLFINLSNSNRNFPIEPNLNDSGIPAAPIGDNETP